MSSSSSGGRTRWRWPGGAKSRSGCGRYREAGADLVFVDGIRSQEDLLEYARRVVDRGLPALYNGALRPAGRIEDLGFRVQIVAGAALSAAYSEAYKALLLAHRTGDLRSVTQEIQARTPADESLTDVLGLPAVYQAERRYAVGREAT